MLGAVAAPSAAAQVSQVRVPSPGTPVRAEPPLTTSATSPPPRFRGRIDSRELVDVAVDADGRPSRVEVVQKLVLHALGDYYFGIAAPATDVRAATGSRAEPGQREGLILWQGFSPGGRVLAARATLDPAAAARSLPARVALERRGGSLTLVVRNLTRTTTASFDGAADSAEVARFLDAIRSRRAAPPGDTFVDVRGATQPRRRVGIAPLAVRGTLVFPRGTLARARVTRGRAEGDRVTFDAVLGRGRAELRVSVHARSLPQPRVRVDVVPSAAIALRPPAAPSWTVAAARATDRRAFFSTALDRLLDAALATQYTTLLATPDRLGSTTATYTYELATAPARRATPRVGGRHRSVVAPLAAVSFVLAALCAAAVVWARF